MALGVVGVTGLETSANYVEETRPGVYQKTVKDMWVAATLFNPLIAFFALGVCTNEELYAHPNDLLVVMGQTAAGTWLAKLVAVDAIIVLAGGVLTAYVGVGGLMKRLALDRCIPGFFLATNRWRNTNHNIALFFFAVSTSMLLILNGSLVQLGGIFALAFLSVLVRRCVAMRKECTHTHTHTRALSNRRVEKQEGNWRPVATGAFRAVVPACGMYRSRDPVSLVLYSCQFLFVLGCVLVKLKRASLQRAVKANAWHLLWGFLLVTWGIVGTAMRSLSILGLFVRRM